MANKCTSGSQAPGIQNGQLPVCTELWRTSQKTDSNSFSLGKIDFTNKSRLNDEPYIMTICSKSSEEILTEMVQAPLNKPLYDLI